MRRRELARTPGTLALRAAAISLLLGTLGSCAGPEPWKDCRRRLDRACLELGSEDLSVPVRSLNELLAETEEEASEFALQRFYAAYLLAEIHTTASLTRPFVHERTSAGPRIGAIGQRSTDAEGDPPGVLPSTTSHVVASLYYASLARSWYGEAALSGPSREGVTLLPDELWNRGVNDADAHLQIVQTSAYARLGFHEEVAKVLERSPDLLELESCLARLEAWGVQAELVPWVCVLIFDFLKTRDEEAAYRFAVVAVEGGERFGHALPDERIAAIEDWIVNGASVLFVCPDSRAAYIPGRRASPISGVPHLQYVAVER